MIFLEHILFFILLFYYLLLQLTCTSDLKLPTCTEYQSEWRQMDNIDERERKIGRYYVVHATLSRWALTPGVKRQPPTLHP